MSGEAPAFPVVDVECYAGYPGEETPRWFQFGERQIEIAEVVDRWRELTWFRRSANGGPIPSVRQIPNDRRWTLRCYGGPIQI